MIRQKIEGEDAEGTGTTADNLLTQDEACEFLGVSRWAIRVYRRRKRNPLPFLRVGRWYRYRKEDLEEWAKQEAADQHPD